MLDCSGSRTSKVNNLTMNLPKMTTMENAGRIQQSSNFLQFTSTFVNAPELGVDPSGGHSNIIPPIRGVEAEKFFEIREFAGSRRSLEARCLACRSRPVGNRSRHRIYINQTSVYMKAAAGYYWPKSGPYHTSRRCGSRLFKQRRRWFATGTNDRLP
jgi:hypothetical protein